MAYRTLRIADVGPLSVDGLTWHPLRHALDVRGFGLNAYSAAAPGDELIEDHVEGDESGGHQELYVVLTGRARFTVDGEELLVDAGSVVFLPDPRSRRGAVADAPDTLVMAVGGDPAAPYEVSPLGGPLPRARDLRGRRARRGGRDPARGQRRAPGGRLHALRPRVPGGADRRPRRRAGAPQGGDRDPAGPARAGGLRHRLRRGARARRLPR